MPYVNIPPDTFVTVEPDDLRRFVSAASQRVGLPTERADLLAELLVANDLRGVFSHGSRQIATYARLMRDGRLNSRPEPAVVREASTSVLVDGDGGLGYFPAHQGTQLVIDKALDAGIAIMLTRNHGHFGAAGLYSRMTLEHDLLCFVTSGHQLDLAPGAPVFDAAGGSPMSFSAPTATEDPLLLDFGAMHDLYADAPLRELLAEQAPGLVLRAIGLGTVCQSWGGLLAGIPIDPGPVRAQLSRRQPGLDGDHVPDRPVRRPRAVQDRDGRLRPRGAGPDTLARPECQPAPRRSRGRP